MALPRRAFVLGSLAAAVPAVAAIRGTSPPPSFAAAAYTLDTRAVTTQETDTAVCIAAAPFTPMPVGNTDYAALPTMTRVPAQPHIPERPDPLRLAWFQGQDHVSYGTATIMTATSDDDGVTWSTPQRYPWADSLRDPGLSLVEDDVVWLSYFTGTEVNPASGVYVRQSLDGGATFGTPRRVDPTMPYAACSAPLRSLGDNLLLPWYGRRDGDTHDSAWLSHQRAGSGEWAFRLIADGQADGRDYSEPWLLIDYPDPATRRLQVFHRFGGRDRIGLTWSSNGGASWASRPLFPGWGKPAAIRRSDGLLVVIYRSIEDSSAVYAVSEDGGVSWDAGRMLVPNTAHTDLGMIYAAPVEAADGRVYVVVAMETAGGAGCRLWHGHLECS